MATPFNRYSVQATDPLDMSYNIYNTYGNLKPIFYPGVSEQQQPKQPSLGNKIVETAKNKAVDAAVNKIIGSIGASGGASGISNMPSLGVAGMENILAGAPWDAVASTTLPNGAPGFLLSSGETVAQSAAPSVLGQAAPYLGAVGAAASAYGLWNANQNKSPVSGALSGAGLGASLAMLGAGPVGWLAGGGALLGAGIGALGKIGDKDRFKEEWERKRKLVEQGVLSPDQLGPEPMKGRSKGEMQRTDLPADFVGFDQSGTWVNNKFNQSRKESDAKAEDFWGYSVWSEEFGKDWLQSFSEDQRRDIVNKANQAGLLREHRGQLDLTDSAAVKKIADDVISGKSASTEVITPDGSKAEVAEAPAQQSQPAVGIQAAKDMSKRQVQFDVTRMLQNLGNDGTVQALNNIRNNQVAYLPKINQAAYEAGQQESNWQKLVKL